MVCFNSIIERTPNTLRMRNAGDIYGSFINFNISYWLFSARQQYIQSVSNGDITALYKAINIVYLSYHHALCNTVFLFGIVISIICAT